MGNKGKHLLLMRSKEAYRKFMHRYFKSSVLPSSPLKATDDTDKISAMLEAPSGRFKEKETSHFNSKGLKKGYITSVFPSCFPYSSKISLDCKAPICFKIRKRCSTM